MGVALGITHQHQIASQFSFKWTDSRVCYLGTNITKKLSRVFVLNHAPMVRQFRFDFQQWNREIFTWFGRINIIKMNIMPRLLYLFQTLPIKIPISFLRDIRSEFMKFIWAGKPARLRRNIFSLPKEKGGLESQTQLNTTRPCIWQGSWIGVFM